MEKSDFELLCNAVDSEFKKNTPPKFYCGRRELDGENNFMWISTQDGNVGGCICHYELRLEHANDKNAQEKVYVELHIEQEPNNKNTYSLVRALRKELLKALKNYSQLRFVFCSPSSYHWYRCTVSNNEFTLSRDESNIKDIVNALEKLDSVVNSAIKKVLS